MFNTKKTVRQDIHENEVAYSGTVTAVTHMTIVVFIPALDVEVDVKRNPDASVQNGSAGYIRRNIHTPSTPSSPAWKLRFP